MDRPARIDGHCPEELRDKLGGKVAEFRRRGLQIVCEESAPADIDRAVDERLVHRNGDVADARDARSVAKRLRERLAERNADILDGVVVVDMEIAVRLYREIEQSVPGDVRQHMIEEPDPGRDPACAVTV